MVAVRWLWTVDWSWDAHLRLYVLQLLCLTSPTRCGRLPNERIGVQSECDALTPAACVRLAWWLYAGCELWIGGWDAHLNLYV